MNKRPVVPAESLEEKVKQVWEGLSAHEREMLRLFVIENLSCKQIAQMNSSSTANVRKALTDIYTAMATP